VSLIKSSERLTSALQAQAAALVRRYDRNGDQRISLNEARSPVQVSCEEAGNPCVLACDWTAFSCTASIAEGSLRDADKDGNGLDADEMTQAALKRADLNHDGKVSWSEFRREGVGSITRLFQIHNRQRTAAHQTCLPR
jgi:Ca2+-binding EF-hand superfamily protein